MNDVIDFPKENRHNKLKNWAESLIMKSKGKSGENGGKWFVIGIGNVVHVDSKKD